MKGAAGVRTRRRKVAGTVKNRFRHRTKLAKSKERILKKNGKIENKIVSQFWNRSKSARDNLANMGLVADPNKTFGLPTAAENMNILSSPAALVPTKSARRRQLRQNKKKGKGEAAMEVDSPPSAVQMLEEEANKPQPKQFKFGAELCKFIVYCMEKYDDDYEAMERDKRNFYQKSAGQIREMIKKFKKIPANYNAYKLAKEKATDTIDEAMLLN